MSWWSIKGFKCGSFPCVLIRTFLCKYPKSSPNECAFPQVCLEGGIPPLEVSRTLREGRRPSGDMAAWKLAQVFDEGLASKTLARVVRVAAQPNYQVRNTFIFMTILCYTFLFVNFIFFKFSRD